MPQVIHIDGLSVEPVDQIAIEWPVPYQALVKRFGGTVRVEEVPEKPGELSTITAAFLRDYEYEDPASVLAIYWRYHLLEAEEFDTVEEAERFLESGEDYGTLAGEAIVDGDEIRVLD